MPLFGSKNPVEALRKQLIKYGVTDENAINSFLKDAEEYKDAQEGTAKPNDAKVEDPKETEKAQDGVVEQKQEDDKTKNEENQTQGDGTEEKGKEPTPNDPNQVATPTQPQVQPQVDPTSEVDNLKATIEAQAKKIDALYGMFDSLGTKVVLPDAKGNDDDGFEEISHKMGGDKVSPTISNDSNDDKEVEDMLNK